MADVAAWSPSTDRTWPPIHAAPLIREVDAALLALLQSLSHHEWSDRTIAGAWTVRDVTAHLLDTALRRLSFARDGWFPASSAGTSEDLAALINAANAQGVQALGRLSPRVLLLLMDGATRELHDYLDSLPPHGRATFSVSWAGESESENWFDIARELTERWHHQAQIRLAVGRPGLFTPRVYQPVLDCFLRALPHTYRYLPAPEGHQVQVVIAGDCGGEWTIERHRDGWRPCARHSIDRVVARTTIPQEIAWRVFTRGISQQDVEAQSSIEGDQTLARAVLRMTSIVA